MATAKKSPKKPGDVKSGGSDGATEPQQPVVMKSDEPIVSSVPGFSDNIRLGSEGPALFGKYVASPLWHRPRRCPGRCRG